MLKITELKDRLYMLFNLMAETECYLDVSSRGKAYRLHVEPLGDAPKRERKVAKKSYVQEIKSGPCPDCRKLMIAGVCMNPKCPAYNR